MRCTPLRRTLSELYVDFPSFDFFGNPALKPEISTGYDVGFEQPLGRKVTADAKLQSK